MTELDAVELRRAERRYNRAVRDAREQGRSEATYPPACRAAAAPRRRRTGFDYSRPGRGVA